MNDNIQYPITVNKIEHDSFASWRPAGALVKVRPCSKEYQGKTFLGILLGELAYDAMELYYRDTGILKIVPMMNPAIFVPELKKIIWGMESWWSKIEDISELREISDEDIKNCWYVQLLRKMQEVQE